MSLPHLPTRTTIDTQGDLDRLWWFVGLLRDAIEGGEQAQPLVIETLFNFGVFPPPRSLILDGGFERNRTAWVLYPGYQVIESASLARTGNYCLECTTDDSGSVAIANQSLRVDCRPGDVIIVTGWARRAASGTASAIVVATGWDKDGVFVPGAIMGSTPVSLTTTYQQLSLNAVIPASVTKLEFGVQCTALSGSTVYFDDVTAFFLPYQDQHTEAAGPINFTTETVIGTVNIGSARETGQYDVIVQAVATIATAANDNVIALRIRRTNTSGAILNGSPRSLVVPATVQIPVFTMGFDSDPNTTSQNYVLTAEKISGTGTPAAGEITMLVSQRNLLVF